jgi:hypothetical protein
MKTLKERMETELDSGLYLYLGFDVIEKEFLRLTKEWLTQFYHKHPTNGKENWSETDYQATVRYVRNQFIAELLKEFQTNNLKETRGGK